MRTRARHLMLAPLLAVALLAGCTGGGGETPAGDDGSAEQAMELAKETLDETSGIRLSLSTPQLPPGVQGITSAEGVGVHPPAFEGTLTASISGLSVEVDVIAVDGAVHINFPPPGFNEVDPADYGAPDPAELMATEGGLSDLLVATEDLEVGEQVRGGANNEEVLTEYTGTVSGDLVTTIVPSATGDFDVTYTITEDGALRQAVLTGDFYADGSDVTYTLDIEEYDVTQDIQAP